MSGSYRSSCITFDALSGIRCGYAEGQGHRICFIALLRLFVLPVSKMNRMTLTRRRKDGTVLHGGMMTRRRIEGYKVKERGM